MLPTKSIVSKAQTLLLAAGIVAALASPAAAQTVFTYQGVLSDGSGPVTGTESIRFRLYDAPMGGTLYVQTTQNVDVTDGVFSAPLNLGTLHTIDPASAWLEIAVSTGPGTFDVLGRQQITAAPFSINTRGITVDASGNVGLGTASPENPLHLKDGDAGVTPNPNADIVIESTSEASINLISGANEESSIFFGNPDVGATGAAIIFNPFGGQNPDGLNFRVGQFPNEITALAVANDGKVGIGTIAPITDLHVSGNSFLSLPSGIATLPTSTSILELGSFSDVQNALTVRGQFPQVTPVFNITREGTMLSRTSSGTTVVSIGNNGNSPSNGGEIVVSTQVGSEAASLRVLDVQGIGTVGVGSAYFFIETSDVRTKRDIKTIQGALETVGDLRGVSYKMKDAIDPQTTVGFIAQEVEKVVPSLVMTDEDGMKAVAYSKVTALLVEAVKEQQAGIEARDARINDLEARLDALEAQAASASKPRLFGASMLWPMAIVGGVGGLALATRRNQGGTKQRG